MVFLVKKRSRNTLYYWIAKSEKENGKVKQIKIIYIGTAETLLIKLKKLEGYENASNKFEK